jgi:hypothetical protein
MTAVRILAGKVVVSPETAIICSMGSPATQRPNGDESLWRNELTVPVRLQLQHLPPNPQLSTSADGTLIRANVSTASVVIPVDILQAGERMNALLKGFSSTATN